jgi:tRNA(fMet)-specific endonuclease VapC
MLVSAVTTYELWYGVAKSARPEAHARLVESFFAGPVALLPFEEEDARTAGRIRATLQSTGERIGAYDVLIAGQAIRHKLTLVTAKVREFGRMARLGRQGWSRS